MLTYTAARDTLVEQLRADAAAHAAERYDEIGRRFDRLEHQFPTGTAASARSCSTSVSRAAV